MLWTQKRIQKEVSKSKISILIVHLLTLQTATIPQKTPLSDRAKIMRSKSTQLPSIKLTIISRTNKSLGLINQSLVKNLKIIELSLISNRAIMRASEKHPNNYQAVMNTWMNSLIRLVILKMSVRSTRWAEELKIHCIKTSEMLRSLNLLKFQDPKRELASSRTIVVTNCLIK